LSPDPAPGTPSMPSTIRQERRTQKAPRPAKRSPRGSATALSSGKPQLASGCPTRSSQTYLPQTRSIHLSLSELRKTDLTNGCCSPSAPSKWSEAKLSLCALYELQKENSTSYGGCSPISPSILWYLQTTCQICKANCWVSLLDTLTPPTPSPTCST